MHVSSRGLFNSAYNVIAYMHINQLIHKKKLHIKMNLRCKDINIFQRHYLENQNGAHPKTSHRSMGDIYNLECWETRKEILQILDNNQSKKGIVLFFSQWKTQAFHTRNLTLAQLL